MKEQKKSSTIFAKIFSAFKSKATRDVIFAIVLVVSFFFMLMVDKSNYLRREYFTFLEGNFCTQIFSLLGITPINVSLQSWFVFAILFIIGTTFLIASIFSPLFVNAKIRKNGGKDKVTKKQIKSYKAKYFLFPILISLALVGIFFAVCYLFGWTNLETYDTQIFINLLLTVALTVALLVGVFIAFIIFVVVARFILWLIGCILYWTIKCYKKDAFTQTQTVVVNQDNQENADNDVEEEVVQIVEDVIEENVVNETEETANNKDDQENEQVEEVTENQVEEETTTTENVVENEKVIEKRLTVSKSFVGKVIQAETTVQEFYGELRNYLLSFKKLNGRVSWNYDSFNIGRRQIAKIAIKGKTLLMYIAVKAETLEPKYHAKDVSAVKKFEDVPSCVKIKSTRGLKFAKEIIDSVLTGIDKKANFEPEKFKFKYQSDASLVKNGLAKMKETSFNLR